MRHFELLYKLLLSHIEMILAFHSILWGSYLLLKLFDLRQDLTYSILRIIIPGQILGSMLILIGSILVFGILKNNLNIRRKMFWSLAHIWFTIAITTIIANLSSLGTINYLLIAVIHIVKYLRISMVVADDK